MNRLSNTSKIKHTINNEKGIATFETIPLLLVFVIFIGYGVGAFGVVHTGILHNISARTYALETFRHRTNLYYFRDNRTAIENFGKHGARLHGIKDEAEDRGDYVVATERPISFGFGSNVIVGRDSATHNRTSEVAFGVRTNETMAVNPVWIKVQYGICMNANCGSQ